MEIRTIFDARHFSTEKMQKVSLFATTRFFCNLYCLEPGQAQEPHCHGESDKLVIILEGRGQVQVGEDSAELGPGQATVAPAGTIHGVENRTSERLTLLVFLSPPPPH